MKIFHAGAAVAIPFVVFLVALAPRLASPSPFVTWDEPTWTYRSLKFTRALERGDFAAAWQSPHPGVVTLWAGSAGIAVRRLGIATGAGVGVGVESGSASESGSEVASRSGSEPDSATGIVPTSPAANNLAWVVDLPEFDEDDIELLRLVLPWYPTARAAIGWLTAALIALATWILLPLVGARTAAIAGLLIALDPYLLAHSRVLHLDAVLALLITCSALAMLRAVQRSDGNLGETYLGPHARWIAASAALGGLAVLEKSPGVFAAGFAFLVIVVEAFGRFGVRRRATFEVGGDARDAHLEGGQWPPIARSVLRPLAIWGAVAGVTYFAAWPALWSEPIGTFQRMAAYAAEAAGRSREAVYFLGEVRPDPGALFYAVAIPHRLTPLVLAGFVVAVFVLVAGIRRGRRVAARAASADRADSPSEPLRPIGPTSAWTSLWLLALVIIFAGLMGRSAKKFERYDLPVFPAIHIIAAVGLVGAATWAGGAWAGGAGRRGGRSGEVEGGDPGGARRLESVAAAALVVAVIGQAAFTLPHLPYGLSYYNPVLGGGPAAARRLPVGWGEGSDQVVQWLNDQPGAAESIVSTPSMTLIGPDYVGRTLRAKDWPEAEWVVLYIDDVQIREPNEIVEAFHGVRVPEHVVMLNGIEYAWIYTVRGGDGTDE